jgi:hypothetical protein
MFDFTKGGTEALIRNIANNPQILTGDPNFDIVVSDIFQRTVDGDPRILKWDSGFKNIVGLYDQVTQGTSKLSPWLSLGDIPSHLACKEPDFTGFMGKLAFIGKALTDTDQLFETYRHAAHTQHAGKSPEQAIAEFKERVIELYQANGETVPIPPGSTAAQRDAANLKSKTRYESNSHSSLDSSSGYTMSDDPSHMATQERVPNMGSKVAQDGDVEASDVWWTASGTTVDKHDSLISAPLGSQMTEEKFTSMEAPHKSLDGFKTRTSLNFFSKEWWTPKRGVGIAAGASIGVALVALVAGGVCLFNKFIRLQRKKTSARRGRVHARSWKVNVTM